MLCIFFMLSLRICLRLSAKCTDLFVRPSASLSILFVCLRVHPSICQSISPPRNMYSVISRRAATRDDEGVDVDHYHSLYL